MLEAHHYSKKGRSRCGVQLMYISASTTNFIRVSLGQACHASLLI